MRSITILIVSLLTAACSGPDTTAPEQLTETPTTQSSEPPASQAAAPMSLEEAATGAHRDPKNVARNEFRHPVETLSFFGLQPGMTVVEVWPGAGWYTEVLAPALGPDGKLVAATYAPVPNDPEAYRSKGYEAFKARVESEPIFGNVTLGMLQPPDRVDIGPPGSADMAVTFRNIHSFINDGIAEGVFAALFEVLKPGGILGVVQHRGADGVDPLASAKTGYVPESYVIELAQKAGFELVERSEVNANPKDTKDHPEGVWTLPPALRLADTDREKYEAIGESDRMTLKFRKPQ